MASSAAIEARRSPEALARTHDRRAHAAHHGAHVGEVEVDQAFLDDQVDDAGDARVEHLIGEHERLGEGGLLVRHAEKVLVGDGDQGVDVLADLGDAGIGDAHAPGAFEVERPGHDADDEDAQLLGGARDDRCGARPRAATHAGSDENHVRAGDLSANVLDRLLGSGLADLGLGAGAEALGEIDAELQFVLGAGGRERLRIRVGDDEVDAVQAAEIMLLMALQPAPPTPMTVMRGLRSASFGSCSLMLIASEPPCAPIEPQGSGHLVALRESGPQPLPDAPEISPAERFAAPYRRSLPVARRRDRQKASNRRERGTAHTLRQALERLRPRYPYRTAKRVGGELAQTHERACATRQNHTPPCKVHDVGLVEALAHQTENARHAWADDPGKLRFRRLPARAFLFACKGIGEGLVLVGLGHNSRAV